MNRAALFLVPLFLFLVSCDPRPEDDLPDLTGRVVDLAEIIPPSTESRLTSLLQRHEEATTDQVVVLTVDSLEGLEIEDYSMRVVEKWKIGQKGKDNGVLLLVAKNDRKVRIEVGYGLEGKLTDLYSNRIIENRIVPEFKKGNFGEGILYGVSGILYRLGSPVASEASDELSGTGSFSGTVIGEQVAETTSESPASEISGMTTDSIESTDTTESSPSPSEEPSEGRDLGDWVGMIIGFIFFLGMGAFAIWMTQYFFRAMFFGEGATGWIFLVAIGWIPGFVGASLATAAVEADIGSVAFWLFLGLFLGGTVGLRLLFQLTDWGKKLSEKWEPDMSSSGSYSGSSYSSSSYSSSSFSSGSSFSGGGGSFGGGGASGSW
ncbi:MAG: hypothetical protein CMN77_04105 [Spirochaetaceae bacterium]|nr:hypothetical protein [Spirochaetaceae bacterium]|tara:strand:+ start:31148 stop:32278 length:1131 start_codon:yes stop_codon:yes gene_type:complete